MRRMFIFYLEISSKQQPINHRILPSLVWGHFGVLHTRGWAVQHSAIPWRALWRSSFAERRFARAKPYTQRKCISMRVNFDSHDRATTTDVRWTVLIWSSTKCLCCEMFCPLCIVVLLFSLFEANDFSGPSERLNVNSRIKSMQNKKLRTWLRNGKSHRSCWQICPSSKHKAAGSPQT